MAHEAESQYQQISTSDEDRIIVLHRLQKSLNLFNEDPDHNKLQVIGLYNLYTKMADPSVEFLETVAASLVNTHVVNLRQLQSSTYMAGENPQQFFANYGLTIDDPERYQKGIGNTGELLDIIAYKYDYETGELRWGEELNPKALAEVAHERIQVDKAETRLSKEAGSVHNEPNLRKRYRMGLALKRKVLGYISSFPFELYPPYSRDREPLEPTWENLTLHSRVITELHRKDGGSTTGDFGIKEAVDIAQAAITRYSFEKRLKKLPFIDRERLGRLRFQYGAKAANLIILSELVGHINKVNNSYTRLAVPDFQVAPIDTFRMWHEGRLSDDVLSPYFEWASGLKEDMRFSSELGAADYIVRSSAVFSEDGEDVTGAGIYESVKVHAGSSFEDFKDAVTSVYRSTDTPQAHAYRGQYGISKEEMGLVIQKYVSPKRYPIDGQGYINSKLAGVSQLMEVVTARSRNFIDRKELDFLLGLKTGINEDAFQGIHHFPPDRDKVDSHLLNGVAQLTAVVERIWERDVQIEFVSSSSVINFVQVRELPTNMSPITEIQFPDEPPVHTGSSIGVGDMELPVLDNQGDNNHKTGMVVFAGNYGFSWGIGANVGNLPEKGAVIIYGSDGANGHIQTLCAERGLVCIFPDVDRLDANYIRGYNELSELKRVRVVSNGIEGRVYPIGN